MEKLDAQILKENKKLILLVDLDQTLIDSTVQERAKHERSVYQIQFKRGTDCSTYYTKIRPGTRRFLQSLSSKFELIACTKAKDVYAKAVVNILDPKAELFKNRIISADHFSSPHSKEDILEKICLDGDTSLIIAIDDRRDMWSSYDQMIQVKPFNYWKAPWRYEFSSRVLSFLRLEKKKIEVFHDDKDYLFALLSLLDNVYSQYFNSKKQSSTKVKTD